MHGATGGDDLGGPGRPENGRAHGGERDPGQRADGERANGQRERLRAELMALRAGLDVPDTDGATMAERVLAQIVAEGVPVPVREPAGRLERVRVWCRARLRALAAVLAGLLVVLVLTPPVRAAVVDWFDFGGVAVRRAPGAPGVPPAEEAREPDCGVPLPMPEAVRRAGFRPVVPGLLGAPDSVAVAGLPEGRSMITLCWKDDGRTIRLDAFEAGLDPYVTKQVRTKPEWVELHGDGQDGDGWDGRDGAWFAEPHLLEFMLTGQDGRRWVRTERTAGPTLLWMRDAGMTLRLEGVDDVRRARAIAESTL
ncbi:hypothetical protein ACFVS9_32085 [Streptomyces sp. NPDC058008]|uniref:hypothetical protein n=1 Tax=Streptomyces sp. NPDC058008 TaxID=3346303 RepID=UPI0036EFD309